MPIDRPPRFVPQERVRLLRVTGTERGDDGPVDARPLMGEPLEVVGALPNEAQDGWVIVIAKPISYFDETVEVEEDALESVDNGPRPEWRDDVLIWLATEAPPSETAEAAATRLADVPGAERVEYRIDADHALTLWAYCTEDALDLFHRVLALADDGWEAADDSSWISSRWTRSRNEFLVAGVYEAEVTYRRWMSPRRRQRDSTSSRNGPPSK